MSPAPGTLRQFMLTHAIDTPLELTAQMFGLSKATVITIIEVALPALGRLAETQPEILRRLHAMTLATIPEPLDDLYVRMAQSRALRQAIMDDYKATYGTMLDAVNRAAAKQAGTTDGQARDVLAAALPAITYVLGQTNAGGNEQSVAQWLKDFSAS